PQKPPPVPLARQRPILDLHRDLARHRLLQRAVDRRVAAPGQQRQARQAGHGRRRGRCGSDGGGDHAAYGTGAHRCAVTPTRPAGAERGRSAAGGPAGDQLSSAIRASSASAAARSLPCSVPYAAATAASAAARAPVASPAAASASASTRDAATL